MSDAKTPTPEIGPPFDSLVTQTLIVEDDGKTVTETKVPPKDDQKAGG